RPHQYPAAPVLPVVREQHALWAAGGARGVRLHRDRVGCGIECRKVTGIDKARIVVLSVAAVFDDANPEGTQLAQRGFREENLGAGILQYEGDRVRGELDVDG